MQVLDKTSQSKSPVLSLKNIHTRFDDKVIHNDINVDFYRGEVTVLLGASGCGKTTFLRGIVGLESAVTGSCMMDGKNLLALNSDEWIPFRKKIAFSFQFGALFDGLSVFENCAFPLREHSDLDEKALALKVDALLEIFGLADEKEKLPSETSGGMQKRVGIARAMAIEPDVILLDEPTAGLDPKNIEKLIKLIRDMAARSKTVIVVSHDTEAILAMADRLVLFEEAKIVSDISIKDLENAKGEKIFNFLGKKRNTV